MNRTLEQQFDEWEQLAYRQFPEDAEKRLAFYVEKLKELVRGYMYRGEIR